MGAEPDLSPRERLIACSHGQPSPRQFAPIERDHVTSIPSRRGCSSEARLPSTDCSRSRSVNLHAALLRCPSVTFALDVSVVTFWVRSTASPQALSSGAELSWCRSCLSLRCPLLNIRPDTHMKQQTLETLSLHWFLLCLPFASRALGTSPASPQGD